MNTLTVSIIREKKKVKSTKAKKGFMDCYKHFYDPKTEGYGNPDEWQAKFRQTLGIDESIGILNGNSP